MNSLDGSLWQMAQPTLRRTDDADMEHFAETWNFEKGSVESTHKVPTSHYHAKHCHAVKVERIYAAAAGTYYPVSSEW
jgi:hypothetical protein